MIQQRVSSPILPLGTRVQYEALLATDDPPTTTRVTATVIRADAFRVTVFLDHCEVVETFALSPDGFWRASWYDDYNDRGILGYLLSE